MPCGGIFYFSDAIMGTPVGQEKNWNFVCYGCFKLASMTHPLDHSVWEWDALICGKCIEAFLKTEDGKLVLDHKHYVEIYDKVIQEET